VFLTELPLPISLTHNGDDAPQNCDCKYPVVVHSFFLDSVALIVIYTVYILLLLFMQRVTVLYYLVFRLVVCSNFDC